MKSQIKRITFSKILLASLFCGLITAPVVIGYVLFYRDVTDLEKYASLNGIVIFSGTAVLMVIAGIIYYVIAHFLSKKEDLFFVLIGLLALTGIGSILNWQPSSGEPILTTAHGLLLGIIIIMGMAICLFLPYLIRHPRIYMISNQMYWDRSYRP